MTIILYAQPYDMTATGFYFKTMEEYEKLVTNLKNSLGNPVEEFEIQFIDGEKIDCDLAKAIGLNQGNVNQYFSCIEDWEEWQKRQVIIAVGECGYQFDENTDPEDFDVDIYVEDSLKDLAIRFVGDGLFGDVPEKFQFYIDYEAIAHDLSIDYSEITIAGERLIYRCG